MKIWQQQFLLFTVHLLAMPTLINKKYSYYDTPDGEDLDKKAWYVAQWAAIAGKFFTPLCESG